MDTKHQGPEQPTLVLERPIIQQEIECIPIRHPGLSRVLQNFRNLLVDTFRLTPDSEDCLPDDPWVRRPLVVFDIDDTLLQRVSGSSVMYYNADVVWFLNQVLDLGVAVVLVTARAAGMRNLQQTMKDLALVGVQGYETIHMLPRSVSDTKDFSATERWKESVRRNLVHCHHQLVCTVGNLWSDVLPVTLANHMETLHDDRMLVIGTHVSDQGLEIPLPLVVKLPQELLWLVLNKDLEVQYTTLYTTWIRTPPTHQEGGMAHG